MIIYKKNSEELVIPVGLGPNVSPITGYELQMKLVDSSTELQHVEPDAGYYGLYRVIVDPYELDSKTVDASTEAQVITSSKDGLFQVIVNPYTLESRNETVTENGTFTYSPSTANGLAQVTVDVSVDTVNNQSKTVDSSTTMQYVQPDEGYTGLDYVAVNPYTLESKSETITASGQYTYTATGADGLSQVTVDVSINESPELQSKTVDSSTTQQTVQADSGYDGLSQVVVEPYTLDSKTVNPSTNQQTITSDADGLSQVTVNPYTLQNKEQHWSYENPSYDYINITPDSSYNGLGSVKIFKPKTGPIEIVPRANGSMHWAQNNNLYGYSVVTVDSVPTAIPENIKQGVEILGVTGTYAGQSVNNQNKTVDSSTVSQSITADSSYTGLGTVTVNPYTTETDSSTLTQNGQYVFTPTNADALSQVTVNVSVNSSSNTEWVIQARRGITTDVSNVSLTANGDLCYYGLCYGASGLVSLPQILDTSLSYMGAYDSAFKFCSNITGNVTVPNLTEITSNGGRAMADTFTGTNVTSANFQSLQYVNAPNGLNFTFSNCTSLTDASFPNLISLEGNWVAQFMFTGCTSLTNISFPSLETISGRSAAEGMFFDCSSLMSVSFPSLETIYGLNAAQSMFQGCTSLTSASFPELQFVDEPNEGSVCVDMFNGCSAYETLYVPKLEVTGSNSMCFEGICGYYDNIRTLTCKPSFATSQRSNLHGLENLTLTGSITTDFDLSYSGNLTPQSILNVLQAIDTTAQSPGTVTFYNEGLMVNDFQDGRIRTAYNTAVAAGWTIRNLLFIDPSQYTRVDYIESTGQTLNLGNTLGQYDAVYADYEMTAGNGGIFIGTDGTDFYQFGFGTIAEDGYSTLIERLGIGINEFPGAGAQLNTRYQGCMGIYTDDVGGWTWSDFSYGETYPAYYTDGYEGSGSNVLRFADSGNYGKVRSIKVYTNLTWGINIEFDFNYNIMLYDSPIYNYIPLKRLSDNAYGLYEMNTGVFYTAQGITGGMDNNS